ncbi:RHS repeat-associated core domain-containing protein [Pseudomonas sp. RIT-PI-q]|uniref:RHS repeat-associated core domain-containing protein n=1 Tax=Pseudomonas sp. RIT-PI-q TaxID=1690247 RepID=UPI0009E7F37A|nr:RHS repeat-associated core domain-containing protein [Pseudomonas sp. RIT-PI-q]
MQIDSKALLCRYRYDALNRLVANTPSAQVDTQRFYLRDRLATEIQGAEQRSIMQHDDQLLAQQQRQSGTVETRVLATDQQRSVLNVLAAAQRIPLAYTAYGHRPPQSGLLSLLGFNGERPDPLTGHYLLGNGYRAFNPVLMRFNSPDSWSPFGEGGLNAYVYCIGDPVNRDDPTGHWGSKSLGNWLHRRSPRVPRTPSTHTEAPRQAGLPPPTPPENMDTERRLPPYSEVADPHSRQFTEQQSTSSFSSNRPPPYFEQPPSIPHTTPASLISVRLRLESQLSDLQSQLDGLGSTASATQTAELATQIGYVQGRIDELPPPYSENQNIRQGSFR